MTARRVATFDGPHGFEHLGARVGTMRPCAIPETKAAVCVPDVVILAELPRVQVGNWAEPGRMLTDILHAVETLDAAGIPGPYEAVLRPENYYTYLRAVADGGYPAARQLERVLRSVFRSVVLHEVGAVFATRGGDFIVTVGGDLSVGYRQHDREAINLTCIETVAAQTLTPEAVCLLTELASVR